MHKELQILTEKCGIKAETEELIIAVQDQSIPTRKYEKNESNLIST